MPRVMTRCAASIGRGSCGNGCVATRIMVHGTQRRAASRVAPSIPLFGGFTFAENPDLPAPEARIIWHADLDPLTMSVTVLRADRDGPDHANLSKLSPWLTVARDSQGREQAVLSDGWRRIRLQVEQGSLVGEGPALVRYHMEGIAAADRHLLALRRFLDLVRRDRFSGALYPHEGRTDRWIEVLRVHDAMRTGASHRDIGRVLFGADRVERDWDGPSDSLRSRVRRLARDAVAMARGAYRDLLHKAPR